jgi:hypothetical protein
MENINITSTSELNQHLGALVARLDSQDEVNQAAYQLGHSALAMLKEVVLALREQSLLMENLVARLQPGQAE